MTNFGANTSQYFPGPVAGWGDGWTAEPTGAESSARAALRAPFLPLMRTACVQPDSGRVTGQMRSVSGDRPCKALVNKFNVRFP